MPVRLCEPCHAPRCQKNHPRRPDIQAACVRSYCSVHCLGHPCSQIINVLLTVLGWIPGVLHAFYVLGITSADNDRRRRLHDALPGTTL